LKTIWYYICPDTEQSTIVCHSKRERWRNISREDTVYFVNWQKLRYICICWYLNWWIRDWQMTSLYFNSFRCALRFLVWLNQRKLRNLVCNELKWIHRNILQNWHRDGTVCSHVGADDLLKNMPSDLDKYDVVGNNRHL
jgi:hypothetical protein